MGFLEGRTLIVTYEGESSSSKKMPGGGPQGTILGMFLFIILINDAGFHNNYYVGQLVTRASNKRAEIESDNSNMWTI